MKDHLLLIGKKSQPYYIDIDAITDFVKIDPKDLTKDHIKSIKERGRDVVNTSSIINITKYEMVKVMLDVMFNTAVNLKEENAGDMDATERLIKGVEAEKENLDEFTVPFKVAFNTLYINKILKNYEPTNRKNKGIDSEVK